MRHSLEFLKNIQPKTQRAIAALSVAESLTDHAARLILKKRGVFGADATIFLELLHCADYVIARNGEWCFSEEIRSALAEISAEQLERQKDIHRLLLEIGRNGTQQTEADQMPAYLFTHAGMAYHSGALGWSNRALREYAKAASTSDAGELWLASLLSREQQEAGILPAGAIEPIFLRALTAYRNHDYDQAYPDLLQVSGVNQRNVLVAWALQLAGIIETRQNQYDLALAHLNKAVSLFAALKENLRLIWCLNSRSITLHRCGRLPEALSDLRQAASMCDGDWKASLLTRMALIERELDHPESALTYLYEAELLADRELATVLIQKAALKRELGNTLDAFNAIDRAVSLAHGSQLSMALNTRAAINWDLGKLNEAASDLDKAVKYADSTSAAVVSSTRARIRFGLGDFKGALFDLERIQEMPPYTRASIDMEKVFEQIRTLHKFIASLDEANSDSLKCKFWYGYFIKLARVNVLNKCWLRGAAMASLALTYAVTSKDFHQCYKIIGTSYEKASQPGLAIEPLRRSLDYVPGDTLVLGTLAHAMDLVGADFNEVEPYFLKAISKGSSNRWAKSWYALALSRVGQHEKAIQFAEQATQGSNNAILIFNFSVVLDASPRVEDREKAILVARNAHALAHPSFDKPAEFLAERGVLDD